MLKKLVPNLDPVKKNTYSKHWFEGYWPYLCYPEAAGLEVQEAGDYHSRGDSREDEAEDGGPQPGEAEQQVAGGRNRQGLRHAGAQSQSGGQDRSQAGGYQNI